MSEHENVAMTREEARSLGLRFYRPTHPCKNGHDSLWSVAKDLCRECRRIRRENQKEYGPRCSVEGCDRPRDAKGFCPQHYHRWKFHGDPLGGGVSNGDGLKWLADHVGYQGDECLIWPFGGIARKADGAKHRLSIYISGKRMPVTVAMCTLAHGPKPPEKDVAAHSCGKGHEMCVNPKHLRWATYKENEADKHIHGTAVVGSKSPNAKLTEEAVRQIRTLSGLVSQVQLSRMFGVERHTIARVVNKQSWYNVD